MMSLETSGASLYSRIAFIGPDADSRTAALICSVVAFLPS
jgi:hypothetical protein